MHRYFADLKQRILSRSASVAILGLGYVGLPLAVQVAGCGFKVTGIDTDPAKVTRIKKGESYVSDVLGTELRQALDSGRLDATTATEVLGAADIIIICVPTPLTSTWEPDLSFIDAAVEQCACHLQRGQLITLESTTYPGTTGEKILGRLKEKSGYRAGEEFFLAYSPERVDPGNINYGTGNITKVVGGATVACTELAYLFYDQVVDRVIAVSSPAAAEITKVFENAYRAVNIALVNELMILCDRMGLDVWEIIDAAGTKPFGIQTFYPGPGVGGHCIPIDPHYLSWKAREYGFITRLIDTAGQVNREVTAFVVDKTEKTMQKRGIVLPGARLLVLGAAYKQDVGDCRESPAIKIMAALREKGALVSYSDPYVPVVVFPDGVALAGTPLTARVLGRADCVLIATDHSCINYQWVVDHSRLVVDARNATRDITRGREKVVKI